MILANDLADVFRERVKSLLDEYGWTQVDLANAVGCSKAYINHLLTGHRNPGLDSLEKIGSALEVDPAALISKKVPV